MKAVPADQVEDVEARPARTNHWQQALVRGHARLVVALAHPRTLLFGALPVRVGVGIFAEYVTVAEEPRVPIVRLAAPLVDWSGCWPPQPLLPIPFVRTRPM